MFKTPPRPTRISVMPPTPPESGKGTPPQEVRYNLVGVTDFSFVSFGWDILTIL